ncbi:toll-like receptor 6 [Arvicola amphibius]|uniref:toll-like receptor 6 n=1 Tax=Arvicola amphibius TaxID=1047088 RepID=UPI0018E34F40|nr:toll-like receptor 6 [Arvicola amphibius]XP_038192379.1 toll-like receptor 6 [Arvicola amphibius]XP_038192390.1 toll-like receptor 6 [Arvicola amphibius]XP_041911368.1 toll-like receptor 6 [Arvicola amphibius]
MKQMVQSLWANQCIMTQNREPAAGSFHFVCILAFIVGIMIQFSDELESAVDYSNRNLTRVPKDLPPGIKSLNLSQNSIPELQMSDVRFLPELRVLRLSHNRIQRLDFGVFKFSPELEYLDVSHNQLRNISGCPAVSLKHLDLSFNDFDLLPVYKDFGNLTHLSFLGLSATKFRQLDLLPVAHLHLNYILLDLVGYHVKDGENESLEVLNTNALHLVFHPSSLFSVQVNISVNALGCLQLSNIKLNNGNCQRLITFLSELTRGPTLFNLTLHHVETTWKCFVELLQFLWPRPVEYLNIYNLTITESINYENFIYSETALKALTIEHVTNQVFIFVKEAVYSMFAEMNIRRLTLSHTPFIHMICPESPSTFTFLNFTQNVFTDSVFQDCSTLGRLETLILQRNSLKNLFKVSLMTKYMFSLESLDVSLNSLDSRAYEGTCTWVESILVLNLSSNVLTDSVFRCLPPKVKVLDLHNNRIMSIPKDITYLQALQELNVAFNSLMDLPGCGAFSSLSVLVIEHNSVSHPSVDFFQSCQKIRSLTAGNNPFQCTCELREFIKNIGHISGQVVEGWPDSYRCDSPESAKGTPLQDFHMSPLSCDTVLLIVTIGATFLVLVAILAFLCLYFDLPWYLRMMCQWTQTRHRARNIPEEELQRKLQFHAFVSYSEHDSIWVKNELLPNLEKDGIRVCLHERNFIPGKSIVENIIHFIEKSYKSIFVLSPHFIQSEWCHYELYFAHHNLFHEGSDNLILILLEPIQQDNIPSRYHKLRALMTQRTYLEWPAEKSKHGLFWANLRASFSTKLILVNEEDVGTLKFGFPT